MAGVSIKIEVASRVEKSNRLYQNGSLRASPPFGEYREKQTRENTRERVLSWLASLAQ